MKFIFFVYFTLTQCTVNKIKNLTKVKNLLLQVGLSIFVSNIGTEHFVGLVGLAAKEGIAFALYEIQVRDVDKILNIQFVYSIN